MSRQSPLSEPEEIARLFKVLISEELISIPADGRINIPDCHGVYIIYDANKRVAHVGRSITGKKGLKQRIGNHISGRSSFIRIYHNGDRSIMRSGYTLRYLIVEDMRKRALLEALAAGKLCPLHLGAKGTTSGQPW
ncbi:hypothetical protein LJ707_06650 [Mucilaginibacter sp. UR6-1]|uniref:hypothetical protein n=1 Tax=Mucilaginibacter sp. UR6-1 TaxID=1435643 RepID=UPI001E647660|nr:hypothetical protein [Mucilaginibacter sp. UR6-1]MCC8408602.1 hypothetical protein [Mucilaginibacter sp. UR6-1]